MNPTYDFSGQVAFVTGTGSGMGLATSRTFAESGAAVTLADLPGDALGAAERELRDAGHRVLAVTCGCQRRGPGRRRGHQHRRHLRSPGPGRQQRGDPVRERG